MEQLDRSMNDENALVLEDVRRECRRQQELKEEGRFEYTCRDPEMTDTERLAVLVEEVGECARAVLESSKLANDKHGADLRKELIQVAAVATSWVEGMDMLTNRSREKELKDSLFGKRGKK